MRRTILYYYFSSLVENSSRTRSSFPSGKHGLAYLANVPRTFCPVRARGERATPRAETTTGASQWNERRETQRLHHPKDKRRHRSFIHYHEIPFRNGILMNQLRLRLFTCPFSGTIPASLPVHRETAKNG